MKRVLLGTSAIALATAFGSQADAADFDMSVGGYFESRVAYSSADIDDSTADHDGVDVKRDNEINFKPSITLDNGIKVGATVELEGATSSDQIDEAYISIDGNFGRILLGSENSARYLMQYAAPDVTFIGVNSGDSTSFIPISGAADDTTTPNTLGYGADIFRGTLGSSYIENGRNSDAERITYFTPRTNGVQFGVSYARDAGEDSNGQVDLNDKRFGNIVDVGLNYVGGTGGLDVAASLGYGIAFGDADDLPATEEDESDNATVWNAGLNLGWQNWTIGGSVAEQNNAGAQDGIFYDGGVSYADGSPWSYSFTYSQGENVDNDITNAVEMGHDESLAQYLIGVNYALAKGVRLNGYGMYVSFEEDMGDDGAGTATDSPQDIDGFVIGTGIQLSF